ncbi:MAG: Eco57I restriction-modification methylase domain-containing protein [Promethearchaeota archaeon]
MASAIIKNFFTQYKTYYENIHHTLVSQKLSLTNSRKTSHILLNRLMFLYFIQNKKWVFGRTNFMCEYIETYKKSGESNTFFQNWLQPLFNRFLAGTKSPKPTNINNFSRPDIKINGSDFIAGIFQITALDETEFHMSDELLLDILENFFERFKFTISELTVSDQENGIDPSMLGSIYESVIIGEKRGSAGVFYTPKVEVDFMCRIALYEYFLRTSPSQSQLLFDFVFTPGKQWTFNEDLQYNRIIDHLDSINIMDPACGSGAFLIGMFQVILELYEKMKMKISFDLKQKIMLSLLFGMDISDWAIQLTKFRFWLALFASEKHNPFMITKISNLSFNIQVGDSLLQEIDKKFDIVITNPPYVNRNQILPPDLDFKENDKRSPKNLEKRGREYKKQLGDMIESHFNERISTMCDLYVYFFFKGLELLKPSGVMVIISSNSWMNVRFGGDLQKGILKYSKLRYIIENHIQKSFSDANINTNITVVHKREKVGHLTGWAHFVAFNRMFEEMNHTQYREIFTTDNDPTLTFLDDAISFRDAGVWQMLSIQNKTLGKFGGNVIQSTSESNPQEFDLLKDYHYAKWNVFLLAPRIFYVMLNQQNIFCKLAQYCEIHLGTTSGKNSFFYISREVIDKFQIEPEFLTPLIKSPRDIKRPFDNFNQLEKQVFNVTKKKAEIQDTNALKYITYGESLDTPIYERPFFKTSNRSKDNWYSISLKSGKILLPNLLDVYHKLCFLDNPGYCVDKKLICVTPYSAKYEKIIFVILYSRLTIFFQEIFGSTNLGAGALELNVSDYRNLPFIDLDKIDSMLLKKLEDIYDVIPNETFTSTFKFLGGDQLNAQSRVKKQIDEIIFKEIIGFSGEELDGLYGSLRKIIENRKSRSKSTL